MAHANFHLAVGLAVGTTIMVPGLARALAARRPLARPIGRMWMVALGFGAWALVPNLVSAAGVTASLHQAWWADLFVGHRTIDGRISGGLLIGEVALVAQLVGHYLLLLRALTRARSRA